MNISKIVGFVFTSIKYDTETETVTFIRNNGKKYQMYHAQDCCEHVYLADIVGDWNTLLNTPIISAEESSQNGPESEESSTWTFYKFATAKGYVDLRWFGESNGYYSESVDFERIR